MNKGLSKTVAKLVFLANMGILIGGNIVPVYAQSNEVGKPTLIAATETNLKLAPRVTGSEYGDFYGNVEYRIKGLEDRNYTSAITEITVNGDKYSNEKDEYSFHYYGIRFDPKAFSKDVNSIVIKANGYKDTIIKIKKDGTFVSQEEISKLEEGLYSVEAKTLKENNDEPSMAGTYLEKVNYEIKSDKQYLILHLNRIDWMKDIAVTVDGIDIVPPVETTEKNDKGEEKGKIKFEIGSLDSKVVMHMNVVPMGNARVAFRIVSEKDTVKLIEAYKPKNTAPVLTVGENIKAQAGSKIDLMAGVSAQDNEDGDITSKVKIEAGNLDVDNPLVGTYKVTYSVTDKDGETVTATREVNVVSKINEINKLTDGVYTIGFNAYKLDKPSETSMLQGFFDKNVKLEVKDGKAKLTFLNTFMATELYDFRIENSGVYEKSIATGYGQAYSSGEYEKQTFEMPISNLDVPHKAGVLVGAMGGQRSYIGNVEKYTQLKIVFNKDVKEGWDGFEDDKKRVDDDAILNKALAYLDKDKDGIVSDAELADAKGGIDLSSKKIRNISRLKNLGSGVTELHLNGNDISELPEGIFDNLTELRVLYLNGNKIHKLPKGVFDKLTKLETLGLSSNLIGELPEGIFDNLTNLTEELSLSKNRISNLSTGIFDKLTKLKSLAIAENNLKALPEDIFDKMKALEGLYLYENKIENIPTGICNLEKLEGLHMNNNKISVVPKEMGKLTNLKNVDLSKNFIKEIPEEVYKGLVKVSRLDLRDNELTEMSASTIEGLSEITNLDISLNKLKEIPKISEELAKKIYMTFYPQKTVMDFKLTAKDGKINWTYDLSTLDVLCWYRVFDSFGGKKTPTTIEEYKALLNNRDVKDVLNDKGFDWTIVTELQKKDSNGNYITINISSTEEEVDSEGSFDDPSMKNGDEYRVVKSMYSTNGSYKDRTFSNTANAVAAQHNDSSNQLKGNEIKDGLYNVKFKTLKENSNEESMAGTYIEKVNYEVKNGKKNIIVTLSRADWMKNISAKVDGKEIIPSLTIIDKNEKGEERGTLVFEVGSLDSQILLGMNVVPMGNARVAFRLLLDKNSLEEITLPKTDDKQNNKEDKKENNGTQNNLDTKQNTENKHNNLDGKTNKEEDKLVEITPQVIALENNKSEKVEKTLPKTGLPINNIVLGGLGAMVSGLGLRLKRRERKYKNKK